MAERGFKHVWESLERGLFRWGWTLFFAGIPLFGASAPGLLLILIHWLVGWSPLSRGAALSRNHASTKWYRVAVVGLIASYMLSLIPSVNVAETLRLGTQYTLVALFGFTYAYRMEIARPDWWQQYVWPLPITGAVSAIIGLSQYVDGVRRITGVHSNPNQLSTAILINLFLGVAVLSRYRDWRRWLIIPYVLLLVAAMLATGSRGAWVGTLAGILMFFVALLAKNWPSDRRRAFTLGVGGIVVSLLVVFLLYAAVDPGVQRRMASIVDVGANQDRIILYGTMWNMIKAHPWLGVGVGNIVFRFAEFREAPRGAVHDIAHNYFLQSLGETGIVGTVFLVLLWVVWLIYGWPGRHGSPAVLFMYSLLVALFVRDQFDNALTISYTSFLLNWLGGTLVGSRQKMEKHQ